MKPGSQTSSANKGLDEESVVKFKAEQKNKEIEDQNRQLKYLMYQLTFQVFLLVADADGEIDAKEITQFRECLNDRKQYCSNVYTKRMFHVTIKNFVLLLDQYRRKRITKSLDQVEETMSLIVKTAPGKIVAAICNDLYKLGVAIAEASGGFIGMGSKISKEESAVLAELKKIFDTAVEVASKRELQKKKKSR